MRTNRILAAALLAAAALTACDKDNGGTQQPDGRTPVRFAADIERSATPATRAAGTAWAENDAIGIFMVENGTTDIAGGAVNRQYTTDGDGSFIPADGDEIFYPTDGAVDFIAYYPYQSATLSEPLDIAVETVQTTENQPDFDLLYSDNATDFSKSSTGAVALTFDHKLSKFVIKPIAGTDVTADEFENMSVKIEGMNTAATFDLATGTLGTPGTVADITPRTVTAGSVYDAIVIPTDYEAGEVKVLFTIDDDTFTWTSDAEIFVGGKEYVYTVTLSRTAVGTDVAVTGDINPWETNPHDSVTVTPDDDIDDVLGKITDANFKAAVAEMMAAGDWDTDGNDKLSPAEAAAVTGEMNVSNKEITSLAGIEYFTALTYLSCNNNDLTALDVSALTALTYLNCSGNALDALDVSALTALIWLYCSDNALDALDVSKNTALTSLSCHRNSLDALDVSKNTALTALSCNGNALNALDVSANTALTTLYCGDGSTVLTVTVDAAHDISTDGNLEVRASDGSGTSTTRITALNTETNGVTVTAGGTSGDPQTIDAPEDGITGLDAPATGAAPTATVPETDEWTATLAWMVKVGVSGYVPFTDDAFAAETEYSVDITLTAKTGYQFAIDPKAPNKRSAWQNYSDDFAPDGSTYFGIYSTTDDLSRVTTTTTVTIQVTFPATAADPTGDNITIGGADDENEDWEE